MTDALRVYGVATLNGESHALPSGIEVVSFKDVAALAMPVSYQRVEPDEGAIIEHHDIVQQVFAYHAILPAPVGVIFRGRDALQRWLELHYFTLSDGLAFVEGRCVARLHVRDAEDDLDEDDRRALANEIFRELRREAASAVPLKRQDEGPDDEILRASFLLERSRWDHFHSRAVGEEKRHEGVRVKVTGPWPPYDFVRLQFAR